MKPRHAAAPSRIMIVLELAQYLRVHHTTAYRLIRKDQLPYFKVGTDYRLDKDEIQKWIADGEVKG